MKKNQPPVVKGISLLLLTFALLLSSAGVHYVSAVEKNNFTKTEKKKNAEKEDAQVSSTPALEAVIVSVLAPDFAQEILFELITYTCLDQEVTFTPKRIFISEKYFRTLFTHIISPNAP